MPEQGRRGAAVDAVVNGVVTGAWYALPDVVTSRRARAALKVGLVVAGMARTAPPEKPADGGTTDDDASGTAPESGVDLTSLVARMATEPVIDAQSLGLGATSPARSPRKAKMIAVSLIALTLVGTVAGERAIHRWGERLTARGVRFAHTRIGLVAGGVTGVGTWVLAR